MCKGCSGLEVFIPKSRGPGTKVPLVLAKALSTLCPLGAISAVVGQQAFHGLVGSAQLWHLLSLIPIPVNLILLFQILTLNIELEEGIKFSQVQMYFAVI